MSKNCLVTKLKGSVDAQLPELGVLKLKIAVTGDYSGDSSKKSLVNYFSPDDVQAALNSNKDFEMVLSGGNAYWAYSFGASNYGNTLSLDVLKAHPTITSYMIVCDADDNNVTITIKNKYNCPVINGDFSDFPEYNNLKSVIEYANPTCIRNLWNFDGEILDDVKGDLSKCQTFILTRVLVKSAVTSKLLNPRVQLACILEDGNGVPYNCATYNGTVKTWTLGSRQNATFVSFFGGISLSTATDIDNFLIDLSTCHDNTEGVTINKKIQIHSYALPTSASTQAIQTLKEAGYTSIKVGSTEYITD